MSELIIIPANTAIPKDIRAAAPAPVAITSGKVPKMNASEVIRIGRKRNLPPSRAALSMLSPAA